MQTSDPDARRRQDAFDDRRLSARGESGMQSGSEKRGGLYTLGAVQGGERKFRPVALDFQQETGIMGGLELARAAGGDDAAVAHERDGRAIFGLVEVMRGDEDGRSGRGQVVDDVPKHAPRGRIDAGRRLVEK